LEGVEFLKDEGRSSWRGRISACIVHDDDLWESYVQHAAMEHVADKC